eukprot:138977_1
MGSVNKNDGYDQYNACILYDIIVRCSEQIRQRSMRNHAQQIQSQLHPNATIQSEMIDDIQTTVTFIDDDNAKENINTVQVINDVEGIQCDDIQDGDEDIDLNREDNMNKE